MTQIPLRENPEIVTECDIYTFNDGYRVGNLPHKSANHLPYYWHITCEYHPDYKYPVL